MTYMTTTINNTPVISEKAGGTLADVRGKAIKYDGTGNAVLAGVGEVAIGVALLTNDEQHEEGADVDIQVRGIAMALAGGTIAKGAEVASDANGKLTTATAGQHVLGIALDAAAAADSYVRILLTHCSKATG